MPLLPPIDVALPGTGEDAGDWDRVLVAFSATHLQGTYFTSSPGLFDWLKEREPVWVSAYSIFVYDLTDDPDGLKELGSLLVSQDRIAEADRLVGHYRRAVTRRAK